MDTYDSLRLFFEKLGITGIKDAFENKSQKDVYDFDEDRGYFRRRLSGIY